MKFVRCKRYFQINWGNCSFPLNLMSCFQLHLQCYSWSHCMYELLQALLKCILHCDFSLSWSLYYSVKIQWVFIDITVVFRFKIFMVLNKNIQRFTDLLWNYLQSNMTLCLEVYAIQFTVLAKLVTNLFFVVPWCQWMAGI